jgi:hypothetical protein
MYKRKLNAKITKACFAIVVLARKKSTRVCCVCKKKMLDLTNPNPNFPNLDSMGITTNRKSSTILAPNHRLIQQYQQPTNFVNIQGVFGFYSKFPTSTENI